MVTFDSGDPSPEASPSGFLSRALLRWNHKTIGLAYLWLALASVLTGMLLSLLMRIHLIWPAAHLPFLANFASPGNYAALTLFHGSLMVFFVLTTAPQAGFGNYFLPLQIGAREAAFPLLSLFSFAATAISLLGIVASFFVTPDSGLTLWTASVALFSLAALLTSLNLAVTVLDLRAKGMTLPRMPLTVWAWFINALLSILIFAILLGACAFLLSDRWFGSQFFSPLVFLSHQQAPLAQSTLLSLWQRLFWFFAQAEVYVAILPCFGIVSHLLATLLRRPVFAERYAVLALCGVGVFGFCVWGQHMFSSGLNPWSPLVFSLLASSLGIPAFVLLVSWLGTLWSARAPRTVAFSGKFNTSMLFALGFVSLFLSGGISGVFLSNSHLAATSISNDFVTGHFHLVMGVAATFALLAALFFWFPKIFGRRLNEPLGKLHFWLTFAGVYCLFLPMHWLGLLEHSTGTAGSLALAAVSTPLDSSLRNLVTAATIGTVSAQAIFLFNFVGSLWRGEKSGDRNPWLATTLEWSVASPPPLDNFGPASPVVFRGAYEFRAASTGQDFAPQNLEQAPWELTADLPTPSAQKEPQEHRTK